MYVFLQTKGRMWIKTSRRGRLRNQETEEVVVLG